jgi:integrase
MPSKIFQAGKKGTWQYHGYWQGREYRESLHTTIKRVAERERRARDAKYDDPNHIAAKRRNETLDSFWTTYLEKMKPPMRAASTIERQTEIWEQFKEFTGAKRFGDVDKRTVEAFARHQIDTGKAPATANKAIVTIQMFFNRAIDWNMYSGKNPAKGVEKYPEPKRVPEFWSKEEAEKILGAAKQRKETWLYHVCLLGIRAGMRKSEIIHCQRSWFDFGNRQIYIKEQRMGERRFQIKDTDERAVDMHPEIYEALRDCADGYLIPILREHAKSTDEPSDPHRRLEAFLRSLGLTDKEPFNRLRRTFGSLLVLEGVPIMEVSQQMGHSSVRVTEDHYIGLIRTRRRAV